MIRVEELLVSGPALRGHARPLEVDPLTDVDALQEAQVLDVRFDVLSGVVAVLFELRQALQLREASTGVLVTYGVCDLTWTGPARPDSLTAWSVGSSQPVVDKGLLTLTLNMWPHPGARLSLKAESAAFFVGRVPGLPDSPPDYTELDRATVGDQLAGWGSPFEVISAAFHGRPSNGGASR